jgi:hypothetical protein
MRMLGCNRYTTQHSQIDLAHSMRRSMWCEPSLNALICLATDIAEYERISTQLERDGVWWEGFIIRTFLIDEGEMIGIMNAIFSTVGDRADGVCFDILIPRRCHDPKNLGHSTC